MPELALVLLVVFTGVVITGRIVLHYRRTGNTGVAAFNKKLSAREKLTSMVFLAASLATFGGVLLQATGSLDPIEALDEDAVHVAAIVVWVCGLVLSVTAQRQMGDDWRLGVDDSDRTSLLTSGLFGIVRNPIYTGILVATTGVTFLAPNVGTFVGLFLLLVNFELEIRVIEEPYLRRTHGNAYESYAGKVGRFVPGLGTLK